MPLLHRQLPSQLKGRRCTTMQYAKKIMKLRELMREYGFSEQYLQRAYRSPGQTFATKINPMAKNSPIIFDTDGFERWRQKEIAAQERAIRRSAI